MIEERTDAAGIDAGIDDAADGGLGEQQFMAKLKNAAGNQYEVTCAEQLGAPNYYGSDTKTTTTTDTWGCGTAENCQANQFQLRFARIDATHANGGRCITSDTAALTGDGTFSARIYIHSNVPSSDGVFTVALMATPFDVNQELDLFVANVQTGLLKAGKPFQALQVDLAAVTTRWIDVVMTKTGTSCVVDIARDNASTLHLGTGTCTPNPEAAHIVVNARARDDSSATSSFVDIAEVKWVARP
ncbi:hypothetical protein BH11MYX1_BH11MYX1_43160 [soil metagenome]